MSPTLITIVKKKNRVTLTIFLYNFGGSVRSWKHACKSDVDI